MASASLRALPGGCSAVGAALLGARVRLRKRLSSTPAWNSCSSSAKSWTRAQLTTHWPGIKPTEPPYHAANSLLAALRVERRVRLDNHASFTCNGSRTGIAQDKRTFRNMRRHRQTTRFVAALLASLCCRHSKGLTSVTWLWEPHTTQTRRPPA